MTAIFIMSDIFDYFMVNVGDMMMDFYGSVYTVKSKNWISAVVKNDYEEKRVLLIVLCTRYKRLDRNFY